MRIDVSEVKSYKECGRKWDLTSRNKFHLRPTAPNPNFLFGTLFHESLHAMYMGGNPDAAVDNACKELGDPAMQRCIVTMLSGYAQEVLPKDLEKYKVLDIEHSFELEYEDLPGITLCGSIDMIVEEKKTGLLFGFEHKTAKAFRPAIYTTLDEQPRLYTEALIKYAQELALSRDGEVITSEEAAERVGGIFINQVKKVQKYFDYQRDLCSYTPEDRANFMNSFKTSCRQIQSRADTSDENTAYLPEPGYMKCQMCDFSNICDHYGYQNINKNALLKEFEEEYEVRDCDHLDEKQERHKEE